MNFQSHGLRSEHLREDSYYAELDKMLLASLRETLDLQAEVEQCAAAGKQEQGLLKRDAPEACT